MSRSEEGRSLHSHPDGRQHARGAHLHGVLSGHPADRRLLRGRIFATSAQSAAGCVGPRRSADLRPGRLGLVQHQGPPALVDPGPLPAAAGPDRHRPGPGADSLGPTGADERIRPRARPVLRAALDSVAQFGPAGRRESHRRRREWDSNPRRLSSHGFSSATLSV